MFSHIPVLLHQSVEMLGLQDGDVVFDLTLGLGGHSKAFLEAAHIDLVAVDQDAQALRIAQENLKQFPHVTYVKSNFSALGHIVSQVNKVPRIIFADIGVSSLHLDDASRGFMFRENVPLDMRMDQDSSLQASDILMKSSACELETIFADYGELPRNIARKLGEQVILYREIEPIDTSYKLINLIEKINIQQNKKTKNPIPLVFQALRIAVNKELQVLERMLESSFDILPVGGKIGVITFHSLEDRIVKKFFKYWSKDCICDASQLICNCSERFPKKLFLKKPFPVFPDQQEIKKNSRSRSARLRIAEVVTR